MNKPHNNSKRRREDLALKRSNRQLESNRCWDELNSIYATCAAMLFQHRSLAQLAEDKDLINYVQDKQTLLLNIRSLAGDLVALNEELTKLHAQHGNKKRGATDPSDMMRSFEIAEQYNLFMERHNGVVLPAVYYILEIFQQAEDARERARATAQPQPDAVVAAAQSMADTGPIDVPVREIPVMAVEQPVVPPGYVLQS